VCPVTGLPDFGEIRITYVPDRHLHRAEVAQACISSLPQSRIFYEAATNQILDDLVAACQRAA